MPGNAVIRSVDPFAPARDLIEDAAAVIAKGGLVVYPTRFLYGLGADALNREAVSRVFETKQRAAGKPVSILVADRQMAERFAAGIPEAAERIMDRFWPGAITLVFHASPELPASLTAGTGTVGIRLPAHPVAKALVAAAKTPITATSANLSGQAGIRSIDMLAGSVAAAAGLVLDAGPLEPGIGSTVIDVTCTPPRILREGAVAAADLQPLLAEAE